MDTVERQRYLSELALFKTLPHHAMNALADEMKYRQYYRGEVIVWQGNPSNILYVLTKGIASVRSKLPGHSDQQTLAYIMPGRSFGEVGILESQPRSASVVALTDVEVLVLHRELFLRILHEHASVAIELARGLGRALVDVSRRRALLAHKANVILIVQADAHCGQTQIGHAVTAMLAFKTKQPTVYTEYPYADKLRADFNLPANCQSHTLPLGHVLSTPASEPGELDPAHAYWRMDQLLDSYRNIVIGLTDIEHNASTPLLEYANQILVVTSPGPDALARVKRVTQYLRQHTQAHRTGVLVVGNRSSVEYTELELSGAFDFTLPFIPELPALDQVDTVDFSVPKPLVTMISTLVERLDRTHQISVYIPTTVDTVQTADTSVFVKKTMAFLGEYFGGATSIPAQGVWNSEQAGLVSEEVHLVRTYASPDDMNEHLDRVIDFVKDLKKELRQEAMALEVDRKLVLV